MGRIVTVSSHRGGTGKSTIAAHGAFLAADRGAKTLLVGPHAQSNAFDTVAQRRLHATLTQMVFELLDDGGFDTAVFCTAETLVTPDGKLRVNSERRLARNSPSSSTPRSPS